MKPAFTAIVVCALAPAAWTQVFQANRNSSLAHFRMGETYFLNNNLQSAANEFREALNGDLDPKWTEVWAHIALGRIFTITDQRDRAVNEYKIARRTGDNTFDAQDQAASFLKALGAEVPLPVDHRPRTEPVEKVPADYTDEARIAELEGTVLLEGVIGEDGIARDLTVMRPLGLGLDEKAIESVRQWLFPPGQANRQATSSASSTTSVIAVDFLLQWKTSRWHLTGAAFDLPQGASRPEFLSTNYPNGDGIFLGRDTRDTIERGQILGVFGRPATATLVFEVNGQGRPANVRVRRASDSMWGSQAIAVIGEWRFKPGAKDGRPIPVPCSIDLMWGPRNITSAVVERFRGVYPGQ